MVYGFRMVRSHRSLIAFGVALTLLAACGSDDDKKGSGATTTTGVGTSSTATKTALGATSTSTVGSGTLTPATVASATSVAAPVTSAGATGASTTSTTVKGRVVTSPSDNVKKGDSGDGVRQIQQALKAAGFKVSVDGDFGNQTDAAVRQFQKQNKLKVDGIVGKVTWGKLQSAGSGGGTSGTSGATSTTTK